MRGIVATFSRELLRSRHRLALTYLVPIGPPLVAVTLFSDLMSPLTQLPGFPAGSYQDYMAAGAVLLPGMMAAGLTATATGEDLRSGFADRLRVLGASPAAMIGGRLLFEGVRIMPAALTAYLVAVALGTDLALEPLSLAALLALAAAWAIAYNAIFQLVAAATRSPHAPIAMQPLFAPLTFMSVFWFPASLMPSWGETATSYNPVSWLTDAGLAFTINEFELLAVLGGLATIALTGALFVPAAVRTVERGYAR